MNKQLTKWDLIRILRKINLWDIPGGDYYYVFEKGKMIARFENRDDALDYQEHERGDVVFGGTTSWGWCYVDHELYHIDRLWSIAMED